jgi:hypothetical protein
MKPMSDASLRRSIRAIGAFLYLISFLALGSSFLPYILLKPTHELGRHAAVLAIVAISTFLFVLARSLRNFKSWARIAAIGISCIGVLGFPFGTFLYGPFLYVLIKSKHLFAPAPVSQAQLSNAPPPDIDRLAA